MEKDGLIDKLDATATVNARPRGCVRTRNNLNFKPETVSTILNLNNFKESNTNSTTNESDNDNRSLLQGFYDFVSRGFSAVLTWLNLRSTDADGNINNLNSTLSTGLSS